MKLEVRMADPHTTRGNADEIHQDVRDDDVMTTQQGSVVYDDQNSLRAGDRGPTLMQDAHMREKRART
ncbi:catalase [Dermacoccus barathri]|nr:catalase [Dermacoccus barathri]